MTSLTEEELVLLTSYFNLSNGRRQDTADTFRVDPSVSSSTSPSGTAALYIITESSGGSHMGPRARRLAADTIAWEYSTHGNEAPAPRLKNALRSAHQEVLREFDGHVTVGVSVIAVEHNSVFLAQVAPAQVYVLHEGSLHSISAAAPGSSPFMQALGSAGGPDISLFRDEVAAGDVVALCSSWFNRSADPDEMRECFGAGTADDISAALFELCRQDGVRDATAVVIEAAREADLEGMEDEEAPGTFLEQVDVAVQSLASVGRMILDELRPGPENTRPEDVLPDAEHDIDVAEPIGDGRDARRRKWRPSMPSTAEDDAQSTTEIRAISPDDYAQTSSDSEPADPWNPERTDTWELQELHAPPPPRRAVEQPTDEVPAVSPDDWADEHERGAEEWREERSERAAGSGATEWSAPDALDDEEDTAHEGRQVSELEEVNWRLKGDQLDMADVIPPVQGFPDSSTEPSRIYATSRDIQAVNRRPRRFGGISKPGIKDPVSATPVVRPGLDGIDLRRPMGRSAPPALVWLVAAVVLCLAVIAAWKLSNRSSTPKANPYPAKVQKDIRLARSAKAPAQQDTYLRRARKDLGLARTAGAPATRLHQLSAQIVAAGDLIYHITREAAPVVQGKFQLPTEIAVGPDSLFVLDPKKGGVLQKSFNSTSAGTEIISNAEPDSGIQAGTIKHIATSSDVALALDQSNVLIRDDAGTKSATVLQPSTGQNIVAMINYGPDVYLLDTADSQVWRYADAVAGFSPAQTPYLSSPPNLGKAVSFTMDDTHMYILESTGGVLAFDIEGRPTKFNLTMPPGVAPMSHPVWIFTDVSIPHIWIADSGTGRILQFSKTGAYQRSYVSANSALALRQVKSIAVPPGDKTLFVLAGTQVFSFPVSP